VVDTSVKKPDEPPSLKKFVIFNVGYKYRLIFFRLVDRFRYDEPQARPERDSITSDFWWLHGIIFLKKYFLIFF
jgi:hypothetical protein